MHDPDWRRILIGLERASRGLAAWGCLQLSTKALFRSPLAPIVCCALERDNLVLFRNLAKERGISAAMRFAFRSVETDRGRLLRGLRTSRITTST